MIYFLDMINIFRFKKKSYFYIHYKNSLVWSISLIYVFEKNSKKMIWHSTQLKLTIKLDKKIVIDHELC